jgi:thiol:disulfide interchange protein
MYWMGKGGGTIVTLTKITAKPSSDIQADISLSVCTTASPTRQPPEKTKKKSDYKRVQNKLAIRLPSLATRTHFMGKEKKKRKARWVSWGIEDDTSVLLAFLGRGLLLGFLAALAQNWKIRS